MFEIYGRNNCVWCDRAKELLDREKLPYKYFNIEEDFKTFFNMKSIFGEVKTVPQILLLTPNDGDHEYKIIGGFEDLRKWLKEHYTRA